MKKCNSICIAACAPPEEFFLMMIIISFQHNHHFQDFSQFTRSVPTGFERNCLKKLRQIEWRFAPPHFHEFFAVFDILRFFVKSGLNIDGIPSRYSRLEIKIGNIKIGNNFANPFIYSKSDIVGFNPQLLAEIIKQFQCFILTTSTFLSIQMRTWRGKDHGIFWSFRLLA